MPVDNHDSQEKPGVRTAISDRSAVTIPLPSNSWRPSAVAWLLLCLLLGGFCFTQSKPTTWATPAVAEQSETVSRQIPTKKFESKPIQDIRTGMRVVANNPELNGQNAHQAEIDPAT